MNEGFIDRFLQALPDHQDGVALDVGAHVGTFTRIMAKKFSAVYAFEPHPDNFAKLVEAMSDLPNVIPIRAAISDKPGIVNLYVNPNVGAHTIDLEVASSNWGHHLEKYVGVQAITLDRFCAPFLERVRLIKVDIEGAEAFIFRGGVKLLTCVPGPIVLLELHNIPKSTNDIYHQFADIGYTFTDECDRDNVNPLVVDTHYVIRRNSETR